MIFKRRRPQPPPEPDWDDPMWVPQPVERWIEPQEIIDRQRRRRGRWRALRHSVVLLLVILVVGGVGVIAGGAVLGRWDLPWSPPRTADRAAPGPTTLAIDCEPAMIVPAGVSGTSVEVLNATTRSGLANSVGDELESRGFTVVDVGNYRGTVVEPALVLFPSGAEPAALAVAAQLAEAEVALDPTVEVVTAVLGEGWSGVHDVDRAAVSLATPQAAVSVCADQVDPEAGGAASPAPSTG